MNRILLLLAHRENCRLLSEWLSLRYQVFFPQSGCPVKPLEKLFEEAASQELDQPFDLCILDGPMLDRLWKQVQRRRQAESVFLPFLLVTSRQDVGMASRHLWQSVDELIISPIEKVELQARVEILLRSRRLSSALNVANEKIHSEINEHQQTQESLVESQAKLNSLIQNSSDIIAILDSNGTIKYKSPSTQEILGLSPEELEGQNHFDLIHPDDCQEARNSFQIGLKSPGKTQVSVYRFRHRDGSWRYLETKSNFINHGLDQIVINSRDITERKQAEEEIQKALEKERDLIELKSRFVSMVSHEIRSPLNVILASTQILERYGEKWSNEKKTEFFSRIKEAVRKMTELLNDVLLLGKVEFGRKDFNPIPVNLAQFCNELVTEIKMSAGGKHEIKFVNQSQDTNAYVDKKLLRHILSNLLSNAIKYSPQGSKVNIELSCQDAEAIFAIQDEGIGIPLEEQSKLFESFYRASNAKNIPGTGLGLSVVKQSVDIHGGKIAVNSKTGVGTTFTVTLPIAQPDSKNSGVTTVAVNNQAAVQ